MRFFFNCWPPFLGAGIRVVDGSAKDSYLRVKLRLRWYNRNYVGTQFGGSIYAMTDPFYMYLIMHRLGDDYIVWDQGAKIEFKKPGKTDLLAEFRVEDHIIQRILENTAGGEKFLFDLPVSVKDRNGVEVAEVTKTLYVRKKRRDAG